MFLGVPFLRLGLPVLVILSGLAGFCQAGAVRPSGCALLREMATPICTAKLSCDAAVGSVPTARALFAACAGKTEIPPLDVHHLIRDFGGQEAFRCCAGNALARQFGLL